MIIDSHSSFIAPAIGTDDFGLGGGHSGKNAECDRSDADLRVFHSHWYFSFASPMLLSVGVGRTDEGRSVRSCGFRFLVALAGCGDLCIHAKDLFVGAKEAEIGSAWACVIPGVAAILRAKILGANDDGGGSGETTAICWVQRTRQKNRFSGRYDELIRIAPQPLPKPLILKELLS
jgi:hypothetical protein